MMGPEAGPGTPPPPSAAGGLFAPGGRAPFPRALIALALAAALLWLVWSLKNALTLVAVSIAIAYIFDPLVDRLERWRIPRSLAIGALLVLVIAAVVALLLFVLPRLIAEATAFFAALPAHAEELWSRIQSWLVARGVAAPRNLSELGTALGVGSADTAGRVARSFGGIARWVAGSTVTLANAGMTLLVVPVLTFYVLKDFDRLRTNTLELVPVRHRPWVAEIGREIDRVLSHFVRGQLVVMTFLGVAYSIAYASLGVPLGVGIGILAGLMSFVPYVGGAVAIGAALLSSVLGGATLLKLVGVVIAHAAIQATEAFVITPRVMQGQVGVPAFWVIVALLAFGELFGFIGVLLAIPLAAALRVLLLRALAAYRRSAWYRAPPGASGAPAAEAELFSRRARPEGS